MPSGTPRIGSGFNVLGSIQDSKILDPTPQGTETQWQGADGQVSMAEPPPPWELASSSELADSDAKRFVDCPANITLRWINPRVLDSEGWRDWQPVMASDTRFKVHVHTMVSPEGNIRRGGFSGDILAWMYTSWVESRRKLYDQRTMEQAQAAVDKQQQLKDEFARGKYGPYVKLEGATHPRYTNVETRETD
jgi:hypothetical protein